MRRLFAAGLSSFLAVSLAAAGGLPPATLPPATLLPDESAFTKALQAHQANDTVVVLHFWATWCTACEEEFKHVAPTLQALEEKGAVVMLVSLDDEDERARAVPEFLKRHGVVGHSYVFSDADPDRMADLVDPNWPAGALPATFVFRDSRRLKSFYGQADAHALARSVTEALKASSSRKSPKKKKATDG